LLPYYNKQLRVKPGLLSWARVNQVDDADRHNLRERWQYDLYYAKRASLWLDGKIVLKGIKLLFLGDKKASNIGYVRRYHSGKARY
jgi:lipopolysaccharide/colanic/teichoic acid biosynthesis glycosyltransferase